MNIQLQHGNQGNKRTKNQESHCCPKQKFWEKNSHRSHFKCKCDKQCKLKHHKQYVLDWNFQFRNFLVFDQLYKKFIPCSRWNGIIGCFHFLNNKFLFKKRTILFFISSERRFVLIQRNIEKQANQFSFGF